MTTYGPSPYGNARGWGQPKQQNQQDASFLGSWACRDLLWTARLGAGEALDRYLGTASSSMSQNITNQAADLGFDDKPVTNTLTYGSLFRLQNESIAWKDLSWKAYKEKILDNTADLRDAIKPENRSHFFEGVSAKSFVHDVLWEGNIRPFKELAGDTPRINMGINLTYIGGLGLLGWGIINKTRQAYQQAHQQEDGTWQSYCHTWMETAKVFASQTTKSLASWEAAGVGMAIGKALIPIGWFPLGGILIGSLFGTGIYTLLSKWLPVTENHPE